MNHKNQRPTLPYLILLLTTKNQINTKECVPLLERKTFKKNYFDLNEEDFD